MAQPLEIIRQVPVQSEEAKGLLAPAHAANDQAADGHEDTGPGVLVRHVEYGVAAILMVLAGLVVWDNLRIGAGWGDSGPQAGYFPMRIGAILGLCGLASLVQAFRRQDDKQFASWLQLKRVSQVLVPLLVYVALIAPLGIYLASTLFITAFMVFAGRYPWWKSLALAGATNVLLFYVFEIQFRVPLPKGPLESMLGF